MRILPVFICVLALVLQSCGNDPSFSPKPRAYPRVEYPDRAYAAFDKDYCSFSFEFPAYAEIIQDKLFFEEEPPHPCWFDIFIPAFDCRLHCSYYPIGGRNTLEKLKGDAFEMADWHNKKANYIDEVRIEKEGAVSGFAFIMEGPAASPLQFYLTDSTRHFFRAALYFNTQAKPDSLAPIYDFVRQDVLRIIETFNWED
jgi:gliding motility-associated lipoprotein GldD